MRIRGQHVVGLALAVSAAGCGATPAERTVTVTPISAASKVAIHYEFDNDLYCGFDVRPRGPRIEPAGRDPASPVVVGWEFSADYGTQPFPCGFALRHDYIAALYFDLSRLIRDGGVVERAVLRFRRRDSTQPIDVPARAAGSCTFYALQPSSDWLGGYYVGDESDPDANPPGALVYTGTPRTMAHFRNSTDSADAEQMLDITTPIASAVLARGERYHGLLLSPRPDPSSRAHYLTGGDILGSRLTQGSCTGLFSEFRLEVSLVRLDRR